MADTDNIESARWLLVYPAYEEKQQLAYALVLILLAVLVPMNIIFTPSVGLVFLNAIFVLILILLPRFLWKSSEKERREPPPPLERLRGAMRLRKNTRFHMFALYSSLFVIPWSVDLVTSFRDGLILSSAAMFMLVFLYTGVALFFVCWFEGLAISYLADLRGGYMVEGSRLRLPRPITHRFLLTIRPSIDVNEIREVRSLWDPWEKEEITVAITSRDEVFPVRRELMQDLSSRPEFILDGNRVVLKGRERIDGGPPVFFDWWKVRVILLAPLFISMLMLYIMSIGT